MGRNNFTFLYAFIFLLISCIVYKVGRCENVCEEYVFEELIVTKAKRSAAKIGDAVHPIFIMDVIRIPSDGFVRNVNGEAFLKKKVAEGFTEVHVKDIISFEDILMLGKGASVKIVFKDGASTTINPVEEDKSIVFKAYESIQPQNAADE